MESPPPNKYIFVASVTLNPTSYSSSNHLLFTNIIDNAYVHSLILCYVFRIPVTGMSSLNNMIDTRLDVLTAVIIRLLAGGS